MKIVVSSDWQCSLTNMDRCQKHVDQVIRILDKYSRRHKTFFVHCGDVKEHFNPLDVRVANFILESLTRIRKHCTGAYFVRGNHDSISTQDGVPSIVPLVRAAGVYAADNDYMMIPVRLLTWNAKVVRYCLIYAVPYFREAERQKKCFRDAAVEAARSEYKDPNSTAVGKDNVKLLFFHNEIAGSVQSLYTVGTGITLGEMGAHNYDLCVGGHIHIPQQIKNVIYVGSPFPQNWGEANVLHRILVLTINEDRV